MLGDRLLIRRFKRGCGDAPSRIYARYKDYLLTLAMALLNDTSVAEDIVHSVFVSFAEGIDKFQLSGSLRNYLAICVANRARNVNKAKQQQNVGLDKVADAVSNSPKPDQLAMHREELQQLADKMQLLPYAQREVLILHLKAEMKFRQIARVQNTSINTIQSRYRYGLEKVRSLFDGESVK